MAHAPDGSMAHPNRPKVYSSSSGSLSSIAEGTFHNLSVWSSEAETAHCPSGLIAQPFTPSACPLKMKTSSPVSALHPLTVPSRDVESIHLPSGLMTHPVTMPTWPKVVKRSVLVRTSHTFSPRSLVEASHVPSGLIAQPDTISSCSPSREGGSWTPVCTSQIRSVWSSEVEAIQVPSGLIAQQVTGPLCPRRVRITNPLYF